MKKQFTAYTKGNTPIEVVLDTNDIAGITELEVAPKSQTFDANGDLVSQEDGDRRFAIALTNGKTTPFAIDETTYNKLNDLLQVEKL
jgi:hypothetical protein